MGDLLRKHNGSRIVVVPVLAALWLLVPQFAVAQDAQQPTPGQRVDQAIETATTGSGPEGFYVMPMIGSGFGADVDGGSLLLGGAAGYDTGGPLSIEGEFGYMGGADQAPELLNFDLDTRIVSFMANALWHFGPSDKWRPYASLGAGVRNAEVDFDEIAGPGFDEGGTEFAWSFGSQYVRFRRGTC